MIEKIIEQQHQESIRKLVRKFGSDKKEEITGIYNLVRKRTEGEAKIKFFIPNILYKELRRYFNTKYNK